MTLKSAHIERDGIRLFVETVGDPHDPAILLIMGAMASGVPHAAPRGQSAIAPGKRSSTVGSERASPGDGGITSPAADGGR